MSLKSFLVEDEDLLSYIVNTMTADGLDETSLSARADPGFQVSGGGGWEVGVQRPLPDWKAGYMV